MIPKSQSHERARLSIDQLLKLANYTSTVISRSEQVIQSDQQTRCSQLDTIISTPSAGCYLKPFEAIHRNPESRITAILFRHISTLFERWEECKTIRITHLLLASINFEANTIITIPNVKQSQLTTISIIPREMLQSFRCTCLTRKSGSVIGSTYKRSFN